MEGIFIAVDSRGSRRRGVVYTGAVLVCGRRIVAATNWTSPWIRRTGAEQIGVIEARRRYPGIPIACDAKSTDAELWYSRGEPWIVLADKSASGLASGRRRLIHHYLPNIVDFLREN